MGQHYNDGISQLVRFDPTTGQTALDAAGNPTYTVRVTARDLAFVGAKSFTLGLRSGTGGKVITKPMAITVQGTNTDNGGKGGEKWRWRWRWFDGTDFIADFGYLRVGSPA